jgi:hypothetical protein
MNRNVVVILIAALTVSLIVAVALASCGGGKPKQAPSITAPAG